MNLSDFEGILKKEPHDFPIKNQKSISSFLHPRKPPLSGPPPERPHWPSADAAWDPAAVQAPGAPDPAAVPPVAAGPPPQRTRPPPAPPAAPPSPQGAVGPPARRWRRGVGARGATGLPEAGTKTSFQMSKFGMGGPFSILYHPFLLPNMEHLGESWGKFRNGTA